MKHSSLNVLGSLYLIKSLFRPFNTPLQSLPVPVSGTGNRALKSVVRASGLSLVLALISLAAGAQDAPPLAELKAEGYIQLPTDKPLQESYRLDLTGYDFGSDEETIDYIGGKSGEFYYLRARPTLHRAALSLNLEDKPNWTLADWNTYLREQGLLNPIIPGAPNSND